MAHKSILKDPWVEYCRMICEFIFPLTGIT